MRVSWARVEPARGEYDDAALAEARDALRLVRKAGGEPVVVLHDGALPDWQIARGGWLDPDALAAWGCYADRAGSELAPQASVWMALWTPLEEAGWYDRDARRVARVLLDAAASAYIHLRRGPGHGGKPARVGIAERWGQGRIADGLRDSFVRALATGRVGPPFAVFGELSNGTAAIDVVGRIGGSELEIDEVRR
ncbi:MAG: hypothetical protein ACOZNI_03730 [Myxococcota bacterium]